MCFLLFTEHKILIIGLDNAGKTTIMYQYLLGDTVHTSPTIGSNVEEITYKNTQFVMWDLGGQESLRASWNTYYANTQVRYLVFPNAVCFSGLLHLHDMVQKFWQ